MAVDFEVGGETFTFPTHEAVIFAEELRLTAAGVRGEYGTEGALALADAIEAVLVGRSNSPIPLEGEASESVYYYLDVTLTVLSVEERETSEAFRLYRAVRELHHRRLGHS